MFERAHIVQAVSQLDEHDAHIGDHGEQHLANVFSLAVFAIGELDLVDLSDALDDVGDLITEVGLRFCSLVAGVSSTASWRRPAAMAVESIFISARTSATSRG